MIITFTKTFTKNIGEQAGSKEDVIDAINAMYDQQGKNIFQQTGEYQKTTITHMDDREVYIDVHEGYEVVSNQGRDIILDGRELDREY